ncbi:MAG: T9SS type A sorting domain-containing protein, partial [Elusimicrobiota bacterium]
QTPQRDGVHGKVACPHFVITVTGNSQIVGNRIIQTGNALAEPISLDTLFALAQSSNQNNLIPAQFLVNGVLTLRNQDILTLSTGSYLVAGIDISGQASLKIDGAVDFFSQGAITINGGAMVNTQAQSGTFLVVSDSSHAVTINGSVQAGLTLYAPRAALMLAGGARIGGYLFAKEVKATGNSLAVQAGVIPTPTQTASGDTPGNQDSDKSNGRKKAGIGDLALGPDPSFAEREIYAFPNPARAGANPTIHVEVGVAEEVKINVYDMAGDLVHEAVLNNAPGVIVRGDAAAQYAYEQAVYSLPTGVYLYTIHARSNGQSIKKVGRLAVVM